MIQELPAEETWRAHAALAELRPAYGDRATFVQWINDRQRPEGYRLVAVIPEGRDAAVAVAGFRMCHSLAFGRFLYVDDLVTLPEHRRKGYGVALLDWLHRTATSAGCSAVHLDSGRGPDRADAHRLNLDQGFEDVARHFSRSCGSDSSAAGYFGIMSTTVEAMNARVRPDEQLDDLFSDGWPEFITADREVKRHIGRVRELFEDLELVLLDSDDVIVAAGWAVPVRWSSDPLELPDGYTASLAQAFTDYDRGEVCNSLIVMAAQMHPRRRGRGLAGRLLAAFRELADAREVAFMLAPARPTLKARYPLTPIERFAAWTRDDGLPLDPWIRTHVRMGATVIKTAPASQTMTGTVEDWERWTKLALPESGSYVIPEGLSPLEVDVDANVGTYVEPNVWVQHR